MLFRSPRSIPLKGLRLLPQPHQTSQPSTGRYTTAKEVCGTFPWGCHFLNPLPSHGPNSEPGSNSLWGSLQEATHSLGLQTHRPSHLEAGERRAELGAHPATAQARTQWNNTLKDLGFFKIPHLPPSQKQPRSGLGRQRGRKSRVATPGSLQLRDTGHRTQRARPQFGCVLLKST